MRWVIFYLDAGNRVIAGKTLGIAEGDLAALARVLQGRVYTL